MHLACCLWALAGGAGGVVLYRWRIDPNGSPWVSTGLGVKLGALVGLLGSVFYVVAFFGLGRQRGLRRAAREAIAEAASKNTEPSAQATFDQMNTPEGIALVVAMFIVLMVLSIFVFSIAGGAIGASFSKPKTAPTPLPRQVP
jgi:hypothetical protein